MKQILEDIKHAFSELLGFEMRQQSIRYQRNQNIAQCV